MAFPKIPAALYAGTVGQAELSRGDLSDKRHRFAGRVSYDQAIHVSLIDHFLSDQMLRQEVDQWAPKFADRKDQRESADLRGLDQDCGLENLVQSAKSTG